MKLPADGETWYVWPNTSLAQGEEVCVQLDAGDLRAEVTWPAGIVSTHTWSDGDPVSWVATQP